MSVRFTVVSLVSFRRSWRLWAALVLVLAMFPRWMPARGGGGQPVSHGPGVLRAVKTDLPVVALTFNDGPSPSVTPRVLSLLRRYGAHATFFVNGYKALQYPGLVSRAWQMGMEIENHTMGHINLVHHTAGQDLRDLERANRVITRITGQPPVFLRPPYGAYNRTVIRLARRRHLRLVLWSLADFPAASPGGPGAQSMAHEILSHIRPGDIVAFRAVDTSPAALSALSVIVRELTVEGYRLVTLKTLVGMSSGGG